MKERIYGQSLDRSVLWIDSEKKPKPFFQPFCALMDSRPRKAMASLGILTLVPAIGHNLLSRLCLSRAITRFFFLLIASLPGQTQQPRSIQTWKQKMLRGVMLPGLGLLRMVRGEGLRTEEMCHIGEGLIEGGIEGGLEKKVEESLGTGHLPNQWDNVWERGRMSKMTLHFGITLPFIFPFYVCRTHDVSLCVFVWFIHWQDTKNMDVNQHSCIFLRTQLYYHHKSSGGSNIRKSCQQS